MEINVYAPCPGGLDKKIKFCCHDLVSFLGQFEQQVSGGQYLIALQAVEKQLELTPGRACLLSLKINLCLDAGNLAAAEAAAHEFLWLFPENPAAIAAGLRIRLLKILQDRERPESTQTNREFHGRLKECIDMLQSAMEKCESTVPGEIPEIYASIFGLLVRGGNAISARDHLFVAAQFAEQESERASAFMRFMQEPGLPLVFKHEAYFAPAPNDFAGKEEYDHVAKMARRGLWRKALHALDTCSETVQQSKLGLFMRGILNARLLNEAEAAAALRQLADATSDFQEAAEYEALAQGIESPIFQPVACGELQVTVKSADKVFERLQADPRCRLLPGTLPTIRGSVPKAAFFLFRTPPSAEKSSDEGTPNDLRFEGFGNNFPNRLAAIILFGRETDAEPRLFLDTYDLPFMKDALEILRDIVGDESVAEKTDLVSQTGAIPLLASIAAKVTESDEPNERQNAELRERSLRAMFRVHWVDLPIAHLQGLTPKQLAANPEHHRKLLGTLLYVYSTGAISLDLMRTLQEDLGLPSFDERRGHTGMIEDCPSIRLPFLDPEKLDDTTLEHALAFSIRMGHADSIVKFANGYLSRESLARNHDVRSICYLQLALQATEPEGLRQNAQKAAQEAIKDGKSPTDALFVQLQGDIGLNDTEGFQSTMSQITARMAHEPGVRERLYHLLNRFGIIEATKRQRELGTTQEVVGAGSSHSSRIIGSAEEEKPAAPSRLWLPGQGE